MDTLTPIEIYKNFHISNIPSIKIDLNCKILDINGSALLMYGKNKEELIGRNSLELFQSLELKTSIRRYIDSIQKMNSSALDQNLHPKQLLIKSNNYKIYPCINFENLIDGVLIEMPQGNSLNQKIVSKSLAIAQELVHKDDKKNDVIELLVNVINITSLKEIQRILNDPKISLEPVFIVNKDCIIQGCTEAFANLLKNKPNNIKGHNFSNNVHPFPLLHKKIEDLLSQAKVEGQTIVNENGYELNLISCQHVKGEKYVIGVVYERPKLHFLNSKVLNPKIPKNKLDFIRVIPEKSKNLTVQAIKSSEDQFMMDGMLFSVNSFYEYDARYMLKTMHQQYKVNDFEAYLDEIDFFKDYKNNPVSLFWTDRLLMHMGCNNRALEITDSSFLDELVGVSSVQIAKRNDWPSKVAELWQRFDENILHSKKITLMEESVMIDQNEHKILTVKAPLFNLKNVLKGIIGVSKID